MVNYTGGTEYGAYLVRLIAESKRDHSTLHDVRTYDPSVEVDGAFLRRTFPEWKYVAFETTVDGALRETNPEFDGGSMIVMVNPNGEQKAFVLLRARLKSHPVEWIDF